jgi:manganese/iron transport system ATP-binding protein
VDWSFPVLVEDVVMMGRFGHMGWLRRPKQIDHACVDAALARVDMLDYRHRQIGELSGGQKKRVFWQGPSHRTDRLFYWMNPSPAWM